eukprot:2948640-Amphidinium_carterae.1
MCPLRPDIQYATKELTRAVQKPDEHGKQNAKNLLRYLQGTKVQELQASPQPKTTDQQRALHQSLLRRKSTAGTVLQFAGVTIATTSKTQQTIAQSSAEAELHAIGTTVNDVIYVRNFLYELNYIDHAASLQPQIYTDSSSAK